MTSSSSKWLAPRSKLLRAFLECTVNHYTRPSEYPMIAAEALATGVAAPSLGELAGLSRLGPEEQIVDLVLRVGNELGWNAAAGPAALRDLFSLWACEVGGEFSAREFAVRSRIPEVRQFDLPANDWILPLVALDVELDERNRPEAEIERDIVSFASELCSCR